MERAQVFRGIGASPGVAIGRVHLLDRKRVKAPRFRIEPAQVDDEVARLRRAIRKSVEQLEAIRSRFVGEGLDHQSILEAHEMMLRDEALIDEAAAIIRDDLVNAEWALSRVIARLRALFDDVADSYFKERRGDVDFVGDRILRNLTGQSADVADVAGLSNGTVVVAHDLSPVDTAVLSRQRVTAFVTELGGKTSHTSIIARSLEVPAVVGVHDFFEAAGTGDLVIVDGLAGTVILRPSREELELANERAERFRRQGLSLLEAKALPARTLDGVDVLVTGTIELPTEMGTVLSRGGEGIGLYRTEFMFLGQSSAPSEEQHYRTYCNLLEEAGDRPVTIRTLDLGGEKMFGRPAQHEPNPALGLRAIRYCLAHPEVFEPQLAGLLRAATAGDLRIMLPMVCELEELRAAREMIAQVEHRLERQGKPFKRGVPVGIMVEVPSAVMLAHELAREAAFFSVGTNDLLQYLLAMDRTNDRVAYLYHPLHPAVLRTLRMIADAAHGAGIPVSICGEMAADPQHTAILLGLGFDQLSMNAAAIPGIKRLIRDLEAGACQQLLQHVAGCATHDEVEAAVRDFMQAKSLLLDEEA